MVTPSFTIQTSNRMFLTFYIKTVMWTAKLRAAVKESEMQLCPISSATDWRTFSSVEGSNVHEINEDIIN
jgi:hypothetical protein